MLAILQFLNILCLTECRILNSLAPNYVVLTFSYIPKYRLPLPPLYIICRSAPMRSAAKADIQDMVV